MVCYKHCWWQWQRQPCCNMLACVLVVVVCVALICEGRSSSMRRTFETAISTRPRRSTASSLRFIGRRADDGDVRVLELHAVTGLVPLGIVCVDCVLTADLLPRVVPTGVPHRAARTDSTPDCYRGARRPHGRQQICAHPPRAQGYRRTLTPQRRHPRARRHPPTASAGLTVSG